MTTIIEYQIQMFHPEKGWIPAYAPHMRYDGTVYTSLFRAYEDMEKMGAAWMSYTKLGFSLFKPPLAWRIMARKVKCSPWNQIDVPNPEDFG